MAATLKLESANRWFVEHRRECDGTLDVSISAQDVDVAAIEFTCRVCHDTFSQTYNADEALELRQSGLTDGAAFVRALEQAEKRSVN